MATYLEKPLAPSREAEQFVLRFPDGVRDKVRTTAVKNRRSMNNEILILLEQGYQLRSMQGVEQ